MANFYDKYEFFPLSILNAPIEEAHQEIKSITENWWGDMKVYTDPVDLGKVNPPPEINPGSAHFIKILIWEPRHNPSQTALFVNLRDAYSSLISVWNDRFGKRSITLRLSNDTICSHPHHEITVRTPNREERVVYTHFDSKWEFFETGPIQEFENAEYYKARRIKNRLDNNIINEYLEKLGLEIWSSEFYTSDKTGVYFEQLSWRKETPENTATSDKRFLSRLKNLFS